MKLGNKIVLVAATAVVVTTLGSIIAVYVVARNNRINSIRDVMNTTIRQAEQVRDQFETIHKDRGVDMALQKSPSKITDHENGLG